MDIRPTVVGSVALSYSKHRKYGEKTLVPYIIIILQISNNRLKNTQKVFDKKGLNFTTNHQFNHRSIQAPISLETVHQASKALSAKNFETVTIFDFVIFY